MLFHSLSIPCMRKFSKSNTSSGLFLIQLFLMVSARYWSPGRFRPKAERKFPLSENISDLQGSVSRRCVTLVPDDVCSGSWHEGLPVLLDVLAVLGIVVVEDTVQDDGS